jgi:dienelactone hydrolase
MPGNYSIDSLTYGWGKEKPRRKFGPDADLLTEAVDGSSFLEGWEKLGGKLRTRYWKMSADSLALNGEVWYPLGDGPFPLVLMVHGNHLDRDFSDPGYAYLGRHFASHGIIAVTVDENFLNGAWSDQFNGLKQENDCRGWLLLKHLEQWRSWNKIDSSLFFQKVDMDRIVLIGHSRGGEAVSVAACFNNLPFYPDNAREVFDFQFGIRGIVAIAPVDGQYSPGGIPTPIKNVNYFTIHGSMDGDMRSFEGLRQMRRVQFSDTSYHFAAGLYLHGANHGQFNQSWGLFNNGYPHSMFLNRRAIIPAKEQEKVALVYLTIFLKESFQPGSAYLPLFRDYRYGREWLPDLVYLNQFHESSAAIFCHFEEDLDLSTGSRGVDSIAAEGLALWKEGRIPMKWGDQRNNGVFLGWNNEKDSVPGYYQVFFDSTGMKELEGYTMMTFLAADAQVDPGSRKDTTKAESPEEAKNQEGEEKSKNEKKNEEKVDGEEQEKDPLPMDTAKGIPKKDDITINEPQ